VILSTLALSVMAAAGASPTPLKGSLAPLVERFNQDLDKPRVLALLSPT